MTKVADHLERYAEHARRLQTWIGAYGAGLASLLVLHFQDATADVCAGVGAIAGIPYMDGLQLAQANAELAAARMKDDLRLALFLVGAALALQVAVLWINKFSQFYVAHAPKQEADFDWKEKLAMRISLWFFLDVIADIGGMVLLAWATMRGLAALGLAP